MTYDEALAYIASLEARGWRLGLDRMQELVRRAGLDDAIGSEPGPQFIQVAGTNGKGSTSAFLQSMLAKSGYRTGAFFSPYVADPRERVQYGRHLIGKQELADLTEQLIPVIDTFTDTPYGGITEFELKTAIGFAYWKLKRCEWVALEVGLGGRLDATTVVTPKATIIVSIGLDHMQILGDTRAKIAYEKAGIIKPGVPVVIGEMPSDAEEVIVGVAQELSAPVWRWGREVFWHEERRSIQTPMREHESMFPGIPGAAQKHNLSLAVAAMDVSGAYKTEAGVRLGAATASIPGRFQCLEIHGRTVILDGAHNEDAARALSSSLDADYAGRKLILVTNMLSGHDPIDFYAVLKDRVKAAHIVPVNFHRSTPVAEMVSKLTPLLPNIEGHSSPMEGFQAALSQSHENDLVLVTGSFYLVGELLRELTTK